MRSSLSRQNAGRAGRNCSYSCGTSRSRMPGVGDELADLPGVQAPVQLGPAPHHRPGRGADHRRGVQRDGGRAAQGCDPMVVGVEQHQPGHPVRVGQCPVDRRRAGCVVRHQYQPPATGVLAERTDDGGQVTGLVVRGVRVAGRLVRAAPAQEVEPHHRRPARQARDQPVVQVGAVREAVHQHDRQPGAGHQLGMQPVRATRHGQRLGGRCGHDGDPFRYQSGAAVTFSACWRAAPAGGAVAAAGPSTPVPVWRRSSRQLAAPASRRATEMARVGRMAVM